MPVFFRSLLRRQQGFLVKDIELDVEGVQLEISPDQSGELVQIRLRFQGIRRKLDVQQRASGVPAVVDLGRGSHGRGGAGHIRSSMRRAPFGKRVPGPPSAGSGPDGLTRRDIIGDAHKRRIKRAAVDIRIPADLLVIKIADFGGEPIDIIIIIAEFRTGQRLFAFRVLFLEGQLFSLLRVPIVQADYGFGAYDDRAVEVRFFNIPRKRQIQVADLIVRLRDDAVEPFYKQNILVIRCNLTDRAPPFRIVVDDTRIDGDRRGLLGKSPSLKFIHADYIKIEDKQRSNDQCSGHYILRWTNFK